MPTATPDGTLADWDDIELIEDWEVLFLGNGLSINVWPDFAYGKLLDQVQGSDLSDEEAQLFGDTANFERVLGDLSTAIRIAALYAIDVPELDESYRNIQLTLGNAVRRVHPNRTGIPADTFRAIREELLQYDWIFTTSYDMLLYWAMGYGGRFLPLKDHFRHGSRCEFDPDRADVDVGEIPLYYLHGALHLVVSGDGTTWKRKQTFETILDQFGQPVEGDPQARPLFVTEGSSEDKLRVIEGNVYLSHALERLRERDGPVVVFGSSLSDQDEHLVDALAEHRNRAIAIAMMPGDRRDLTVVQADIWKRLGFDDVYFFDATTHPLGILA